MTHPSWVDLHGMAHSFIELDKVLCQDGRVEGHALIFSCECLGVSGRNVGQQWPAGGLGALSMAVHACDLLKEVAIIFITSTIVWPQVNSREGTQLHLSTENWIKDLWSMALPISPIRKLS